ncbi:MAG: 50S ribosomal protein L29 [Desulfovibrionaceae bacterium]|nr:50S ribosomal protein L29 [Desulfovibrionaceae bacterium]
MAETFDRFPSAEQLRELSVEELSGKLAQMRKDYVLARFKHAAAQLEKTSDLKNFRRSIARMETVLREMKRA